MTMSALSDELAQVRTKKKEFPAQIERIVPWKEWLTLIQPCYYKGERGNKPYPLETMLRLYLLQNLYDLSDAPALDCPVLENPTADNPILENPTPDNPTSENPMQLRQYRTEK